MKNISAGALITIGILLSIFGGFVLHTHVDTRWGSSKPTQGAAVDAAPVTGTRVVAPRTTSVWSNTAPSTAQATQNIPSTPATGTRVVAPRTTSVWSNTVTSAPVVNPIATSSPSSASDTLIILAEFQDLKHDAGSDTLQSVQDKIKSINAIYKENSYGSIWNDLKPDVLGWMTLQQDTASNHDSIDDVWTLHALLLAKSYVGDLSKYKYIFVVFPKQFGTCLAAQCYSKNAVSSEISPTGNVIAVNGNQAASTWAHELGHSQFIGLKHLGVIDCGIHFFMKNDLNSCAVNDYAPLTLMGGVDLYHPNFTFLQLSAIQKEKLGYITPAMVDDVDTIADLASYNSSGKIRWLYPIETIPKSKNETKAIQVGPYTLEYRQPIGLDAMKDEVEQDLVNGVWITMRYNGPSSAGNPGNAPEALLVRLSDEHFNLMENQTFTDENGLRITPVYGIDKPGDDHAGILINGGVVKLTINSNAFNQVITSGQSVVLAWGPDDKTSGIALTSCTSPDFQTGGKTSGSIQITPKSNGIPFTPGYLSSVYHISCKGAYGLQTDAEITVGFQLSQFGLPW